MSGDPPRDAGAVGFVSLVGAGPGDPGLLTVRGRRAIERADVVLYDHLASAALLSSVDVPGQERIHVGKMGGAGYAGQEVINDLLVRRARRGERVCRLKGGDPFVLGRGAEEALALADAGVPFEIIPGVSSVVAAPAYAGIPLTHRDVASGFTLVTGHERGDADGPRVDWGRLAAASGTLVVLMGVRQVARWTRGLIDGGMPGDTPVAFIRWGTLPAQETLVTTLAAAPDAVAAAGLGAPAVAVVGDVVHLRARVAWYEGRPLSGVVLAVTHDRPQDLAPFEPLEDLGAVVLHVPLTSKGPTSDAATLADLLRVPGARRYTDLVFTSANGVRAFRRALGAAGVDARALHGVVTWAVGPGTARAMADALCLSADHLPERASAAGLLAHAGTVGVAGRVFLFPAAAGARRELPDGLTALGAEVVEIGAYATVPEPRAPARLLSAFEQGLTLVTVASPSAVDALVTALDAAGVARDAVDVAAIGPTTAKSASDAGLTVVVVPDAYSYPDLASAITAAGRAGRLRRAGSHGGGRPAGPS